jgi:hypothetical protein
MWLRLCARTMLLTLVTVQLSAPDGLLQTPGASGLSVAATLWTDREWAQARRFSPLRPPPADPTNALADNLQAAHLGQRDQQAGYYWHEGYPHITQIVHIG